MRVVGQRGGPGTLLVETRVVDGVAWGRIWTVRKREMSAEMPVASIAKFGYWDEYTGSAMTPEDFEGMQITPNEGQPSRQRSPRSGTTFRPSRPPETSNESSVPQTRVSPQRTSRSASFQETLTRLRSESGLSVEDAQLRAEQTRLEGMSDLATGLERVSMVVPSLTPEAPLPPSPEPDQSADPENAPSQWEEPGMRRESGSDPGPNSPTDFYAKTHV